MWLPLYVQSARAYVQKAGDTLVIEEDKVKVAEARLAEVSQVVLFGASGMSTPAMQDCMRREIPVTFMSYGGWFIGHTVGLGHRNVETRTNQYRASFDPAICLHLARSLVAAKIANCRTLLRRNRKRVDDAGDEALAGLQGDVKQALRMRTISSLLGVEGSAANRYFGNFRVMLNESGDQKLSFDFNGRNRRPPRDPVNAMLSFAYSMLARDMMEPFRPLVADSVMIMVVNNGEVRPGDFVCSVGGCALKDGARKRFIACFDPRMEQEVTHPLFGYRDQLPPPV